MASARVPGALNEAPRFDNFSSYTCARPGWSRTGSGAAVPVSSSVRKLSFRASSALSSSVMEAVKAPALMAAMIAAISFSVCASARRLTSDWLPRLSEPQSPPLKPQS